MKNKNEIAVFAGGCFWCTEAVFSRLKGIISVMPGYTGGEMKNPSYYDVGAGTTGHAEAVKIEYDPAVISYEDLLNVFWSTHNPTEINRQGPDTGTQYRSMIFYVNEKQKKEAENSKKKLDEEKIFEVPIVTEIKPLADFYEAEEYHKHYYDKNSEDPYCTIVINPKLAKLRQKFSRFIKKDAL